jgi:UDPglucose 6-dehydrogenase
MVGTGYVGLVSGTCFAETGITVTCVDVDGVKISKLNEGTIPIYEPGLETMVIRNIEKGRLFFTTSLAESLDHSDAVFIAVGTPPDEDGSADLQYVIGVAREIGRLIDHYMVIVTKSTVPVGTSEKVRAAVQEEIDKRAAVITFDVASNPEFLKEGSAIEDFMKPDRIVIGVDSEKAEKVLNRLYKPFTLNGHPIIAMDLRSSELTKYAANSLLATKISFMNEIANMCDILGDDVTAVRKGIGSDTRIGTKFLYPGVGYGGSCFPKDVKALIKTAAENNYSLEVLKSVEHVNERQKSILFDKIHKHFGGYLKSRNIAIWGLSFKPNTDDMREAPSLVMIGKLLSEGANIRAYDPAAVNEAKRILGHDTKVVFTDNQYEALLDADALVIMTEWQEFRVPKFTIVERMMRSKVIFDGRNIFDPQEMNEFGYTYYAIGRKTL